MYVDCTPFNIHTLIKASSPEKHTVQDTYTYSQGSSSAWQLMLANSCSCDQF